MKVKVLWNQWHLKTIEWAISDSLWICESNRRSICNFTRPWLYLPLPICINCRALAWEGVYVYKLAFFFWLSHRSYHFLFEKRLMIDWRYFCRNIALSLILERSPDYPLKWLCWLHVMFCVFASWWFVIGQQTWDEGRSPDGVWCSVRSVVICKFCLRYIFSISPLNSLKREFIYVFSNYFFN